MSAIAEKESAAAEWVGMFAEGWANPVDADTFCDHFDPWFDDRVRMIQRDGPLRATPSTSSCGSRGPSAAGASRCTPVTESSSETGRRSKGSLTSTPRRCSRRWRRARGSGPVSSGRSWAT